MTAIAYRDGILVSDRQVTTCGLKASGLKLYTVHSARLGLLMIGLSGTTRSSNLIVNWIEKNIDPSPKSFSEDASHENVLGVAVDSRKAVWDIYADGYMEPSALYEGGFACCGCAYEFLIGAMATGLSAIDAIALSSKYVNSCGMGYDVLRWDDVFSTSTPWPVQPPYEGA